MKHFLIATCAVVALASCSQQEPGITFALEGLEATDSVKIFREKVSGERLDAENIAIPNGVLSIPNASEEVLIYRAYKVPRVFPDGSMEAMSMHSIYIPVLPGAAVKVAGDFRNYTVTGNTAFYEDIATLESAVKPLSSEAFAASMASYDKQRPDSERDSLVAVVNACDERIAEIVNEFVKQHSDTDAALYAFYHYGNLEQDFEVLDHLTEKVRTGIFAPFYDKIVQSYQKKQRMKEAAAKVADGMVAPDFTLQDINGKDVTLSSLRGKYVVLDFWGTWCGWCIKGIPDMKKMYGKYKKHLEVVGIACGDTPDVWKKSVATNQLPWINLINGTGDSDIPSNYAVKGYPTKVIIDKDGRIVKTVVGESPTFYECIDSLMAK